MYWDSTSNSIANSKNKSIATSWNNDAAMEDVCMDKENMSSPSKFDGELSMFECNSPARMSCDGSPARCSFADHRSLDDLDHNSLDSGYSACESAKYSPKSRVVSFSSSVSMEESFLDFTDLDTEEDSSKLPGNFGKLITGSIAADGCRKSPNTFVARPPIRRALSMITNSSVISKPCSSKMRLFKDIEEVRNFKRPDPPTDFQSPVTIKRTKIFEEERLVRRIPAVSVFQRSISATEESIKTAVQRLDTEPDLIGDFSKSFCLPLVPGRHQDLKSITACTLAKLMRGDYKDSVATFKVVDCRYPYEFDGGHITSAENCYTKQQVDEMMQNKSLVPQPQTENKRHILVFHCEFSSERGPNLSRYLRKLDRGHNKDCYPYLHYPEVYLLDGGYKNFYETYPELCAPNGYLPMLHPDHQHNLRHFRAKSKTWNVDFRSTSLKRI